MSDHYYRWHVKQNWTFHGKEMTKKRLEATVSIYLHSPQIFQHYKNTFHFSLGTHLLQSSHSKCLYFHGSEIQRIIPHTKCCMFVSVSKILTTWHVIYVHIHFGRQWILRYGKLCGSYTLILGSPLKCKICVKDASLQWFHMHQITCQWVMKND